MNKSAYIERVVHEISKRSPWELRTHGSDLERILDVVKELPSPEKEAALVRMILSQKRRGTEPERHPNAL